jgi:hypothetical protein
MVKDGEARRPDDEEFAEVVDWRRKIVLLSV